MIGRIVKSLSNDYTVETQNQKYTCKARGKFRNQNQTPLVGDFVDFDPNTNYILNIKPRKNTLPRPPVANIDTSYIITSLKEPDFSSNLLDKLILISEYNQIKPIIVFTKKDLLTEKQWEDLKKYIDYYQKIGYPVFLNTQISEIKQTFKDKFSVLTGQSGAGKSTLINKIDPSLNLQTNEISKALNRGKHTTRHTEALELAGGLVADTPGFSALDLSNLTKEDIRDNFTEFNNFECKYRDCIHVKEDGCLVKEKVKKGEILQSRYENYLNFLQDKKV